ncbi:hypothetical protein vseg_011161 [Gypsophila vaccaria]
MGKGDKRSFDEMQDSSVDAYFFSERERLSLQNSSHNHPRFNHYSKNDKLDITAKMAALKASPFLVSLVSFSGEEVMSHACGTIIEVDDNTNTNLVITSLNLLRKPTKAKFVENTLVNDSKIVVQTSDENCYLGEIETYDFHYNLLILKFKSKNSLQPACLRMIHDDFSLDRPFQLRPHSVNFKIGDPILVVGRYFDESNDLMAAPGNFRMDPCRPSMYGCRELLSSDCNITRCGDGAPFINLCGEVIGIAYYDLCHFSPFLPINIAYKWWDHYKIYKEMRHPSYGFEAWNLYLSELSDIEKVTKRFPNISNGIHVELVQPGSYADSAVLREGDVIIKCDGKTVKGFLELWSIMWDKVGDVVELEVARIDLSIVETIRMAVGEAVPDELNKWPRYR